MTSVPRRTLLPFVVVPALAALAVTGVGIVQAALPAHATPPTNVPSSSAQATPSSLGARLPAVAATPARIPGLGTRAAARIPVSSSQVIVVSGADNPSRTVTVALWRRTPAGAWQRAGGPWVGHIGRRGWGKTRVNDGRSPVGVFTLTEAGGTSPAPVGTRWARGEGTVLPSYCQVSCL